MEIFYYFFLAIFPLTAIFAGFFPFFATFIFIVGMIVFLFFIPLSTTEVE